MQDPRSYSPQLLRGLLDEIFVARRAEQSLHRKWTGGEALANAQRDTLRTLETYAAALGEVGWPVPRTIRQDLFLHRSLCGRSTTG